MASMKYIRDQFGRFIIFSNEFQHKDVAKALKLSAQSAGSVALFDTELQTHGESTTLCRSADKADGAAIKLQLDFYDGS